MLSITVDPLANTLSITPDVRRDINIIRDGGTELKFSCGVGGNFRDEDVVKILNDDDVNPDRITKITLAYCSSITDKALIAIADTCHNLTWLEIGVCENITGAGIDAIARQCRKLDFLWAYSCNISHLPEDIGMLLPHLKTLALQKNKIKKIPASLGPLADTITIFNISFNPLQQPPLEIANKGLHAIQRYYDEPDVRQESTRILNTYEYCTCSPFNFK